MARGEKLLARMKANPRNDWQMSDVETLCDAFGVTCKRPKSGSSHATISHDTQNKILTVPARKPIKPVYIVGLVLFIESVVKAKP